jgi:acid phosphatase family membrane protein YuiD
MDPAVIAQVANTAHTTVGGQPSSLSNLALANAVSFQQGMNTLLTAIVAKACELTLTTDVAESAGLVPVVQAAMKGAQTIPPVTP